MRLSLLKSRSMRNSLQLKVVLPVFLFLITNTFAQTLTNPKDQPGELGIVQWYRNYDEALTASKKENKPVLILFQEIPGCATCRNYGKDVLSNPLLADAIANEFIPLAIYNNKGGEDARILKKYKEPSWNNPVVRIVNNQGNDIVGRVSGNYSAKGLYAAMDVALRRELIEIPEYFLLLGEELSAVGSKKKEVYYSMYCFWTGEKQLGAQKGVVNTEAGFMSGREVVKVTYNTDQVAEGDLDTYAKAHKMTPIPKSTSYRWAQNDEDYYLNHTDYKYVPLSELQRTKINSAVGNGKNGLEFLSPTQLKWIKELQANKNRKQLSSSFTKAWKEKIAMGQ